MAHCAAGAVPDDNCGCGFCMSLTRPLMLTSLFPIAHPTIIVGNASLTLNVNCCRFIGVSVSVGVYAGVGKRVLSPLRRLRSRFCFSLRDCDTINYCKKSRATTKGRVGNACIGQ